MIFTTRLSYSNGAGFAWTDETSYEALPYSKSTALEFTVPSPSSGKNVLLILFFDRCLYWKSLSHQPSYPSRENEFIYIYFYLGSCYQNYATTSSSTTPSSFYPYFLTTTYWTTVSFSAVTCSSTTTNAFVMCKKGSNISYDWDVVSMNQKLIIYIFERQLGLSLSYTHTHTHTLSLFPFWIQSKLSSCCFLINALFLNPWH